MIIMTKTILFFLVIAPIYSNAWACSQEVKRYLTEGLKISEKMSPTEGFAPIWVKSDWIKTLDLEDGSDKSLVHDIAIEFARAGCWKDALDSVNLIKNPDAKDSAWVQISIIQAQNEQFDASLKTIGLIKSPVSGRHARYAVAPEFIKRGKLEEGREVLAQAGMFDNQYDSFFYTYAMDLVRGGYYQQAFDFISDMDIRNDHLRNTLGDMLMFYVKNDKHPNAEGIVKFYEKNGLVNPPKMQLAIYYVNHGNYDKADSLIEKISYPNSKVSIYFKLAEFSKDKEESTDYYTKGRELLKHYIKDEGRAYLMLDNLGYVVKYEGLSQTNDFAIDISQGDENLKKQAQGYILNYLEGESRYDDILKYLGIAGINDEYLKAMASLKAHKHYNLKPVGEYKNSSILYSKVLFEAYKNHVISSKELFKDINDINDNYPFFLINKAKYLQQVAEYFANENGVGNSYNKLSGIKDRLFKVRWLIGMAKSLNNRKTG